MIYSTKSIVLSSVYYGESQRIFKCLTEKEGVVGFIVSTSKRSKVLKSRFSILSGCDITYKKSSSLLRITCADCLFSFLEKDPKTMSIIFFLGEVLNYILREGVGDESMFEYIFNSLQEFSKKDVVNTSFHLYFLIDLTRYLGLYPNEEKMDKKFFDLKGGIFTNQTLNEHTLDEKSTNLIKSLLVSNFERSKNKYTLVEKRHLTQLILKYYSIHLGKWKKIQSLNVLHTIFE